MARKKTIAASRVTAKAEGLQLPLNAPAVAQAPAKPARPSVEPAAAVKKTVRKSVTENAKPRRRSAGKPSQRPGKIASGNGPAEGRVTTADLESCGVLAAQGAESLGQELASLALGSLQAQFALAEALIGAKTLQEAMTLQGDFARESLGNMTEGFTRLTAMSMELTQSVMAPIQAQVRASLA